eukprot:TRINITY_DN5078_c0_g1_i2.p1 TRINITY_DN5078_c0_g1~~TRINITY_DN5078_c0_g1_i2.p1  ORF type:complete len:233 (+),score=31.46 TRINITY_DN5078_c0_g1_i2:80-700(+)
MATPQPRARKSKGSGLALDDTPTKTPKRSVLTVHKEEVDTEQPLKKEEDEEIDIKTAPAQPIKLQLPCGELAQPTLERSEAGSSDEIVSVMVSDSAKGPMFQFDGATYRVADVDALLALTRVQSMSSPLRQQRKRSRLSLSEFRERQQSRRLEGDIRAGDGARCEKTFTDIAIAPYSVSLAEEMGSGHGPHLGDRVQAALNHAKRA